MLELLRKLFASKPTVNPCPEAPYKVEAPATSVGTVPMTTQYAEPVAETVKKKPAARKPAGEKKAPAKPRAPRTKKKAS
jgi:hypothetical protein